MFKEFAYSIKDHIQQAQTILDEEDGADMTFSLDTHCSRHHKKIKKMGIEYNV